MTKNACVLDSVSNLKNAIETLPENLFLEFGESGELVIFKRTSSGMFLELDRSQKRNGDPVFLMAEGGAP